ncbi:MAG TPA: hypothetical protein VG815_02675, partial [Chloroflexota bacterium]|nr:hypothetical protein [Chloroflexota bacterium]
MAKLKRRVSLFQSGTRTVWSSALAIVISLAAIGAAGVHLPARAAFGSARGAADVGRGLMSPAKSARQTSPEQFVNCINAQGKVVWTLDLPAGALSPNGKIVARRLGAGSYPAGVAAGSVCRVLPSSVDFRTPALILSPGGQQIPALLVGVDLKGNWVNPASGGSDYSDARITQTGIIGLNPSGPPVGGYQTLPKPPTPVQTRLGILSIAHATWKSDQKLKAYGYPVLGFGDEL